VVSRFGHFPPAERVLRKYRLGGGRLVVKRNIQLVALLIHKTVWDAKLSCKSNAVGILLVKIMRRNRPLNFILICFLLASPEGI